VLEGLRNSLARWIAGPRAETFLLPSRDAIDYYQVGTAAGVSVTPERAAGAIPVQASVALIAGGIVAMPLRVLRRELVGGSFLQSAADDHPYWWLFNESANDDYCSAQLWERAVRAMLLYGVGYGRIVRNYRSNQALELVDIPPANVTEVVKYDPARSRNVIIAYSVQDGMSRTTVPPEDMLHFRGEQAPGEFQKSSIIHAAREAIALTLAIEEYCGRVFSNGGTPRVALEYPAGQNLKDEQIAQLRKAWKDRYGGGDNAALPLVLSNGGKVSKLSFTAEETQMLEARKFQVIDIARAFRVPPFMIGETEKTSAWGSGIEQMSQGFIRYTLSRHMTAIEQEVTRKLFKTTRYFVDFDEEALSRGDMVSLGKWFREAIGGSQGPGILTTNEVRSRLHLPPIEGGDDLYNPKGTSNGQEPTPGAADPEPADPAQLPD
jgi:HK97 family phage portal protein